MSIIKPKRGTGSPAGSIATNEIAMDTASKTLYVSTNGTDAEILANNTEYFLANNTISGITAETAAYSEISKFSRINNTGNYTVSSLEVERELGSSDPATGLDDRGVGFTFTVKSDNYSDIYPGAVYGKSGGKDQLAGVANVVGMSTYGGQADSYAEYTVLEGTKDLLTVTPPVIAAEGVSTETVTILPASGSSNPNIIINQDQYSANGIEIVADKSQNNGRNITWWNFDNAGSKEYVGQIMWEADSGGTASDHYFKLATYPGSGNRTDTIMDSWTNHYTRIGNGFHDASNNNQMEGYLRLSQDQADISGLALYVTNGRNPSTGTLGPNSLKVTTDMSQDTTVGIMNSATFGLDYKGSAIPTTYTQNTFTFNVQNDASEAAGTSPVVGRIAAVQKADPLENQMILRSSNHGNTGGNADNGATQSGNVEVDSYNVNINLPLALGVYTLTEANALSNVNDGSLIYVSNGNAGAKTLAVWDGSDWKVVALGATIS